MAKESKEREEKKGTLKKVLAARLVVFAVAVAWVLGWLTLGLALHPILFDPFSGLLWNVVGPLKTALSIWYVVTFILVGVFVAIRGFRFVGRWEKE